MLNDKSVPDPLPVLECLGAALTEETDPGVLRCRTVCEALLLAAKFPTTELLRVRTGRPSFAAKVSLQCGQRNVFALSS